MDTNISQGNLNAYSESFYRAYWFGDEGNMVLALDKIGSNYSGTTFFNDMTNKEFSAFGIGNCEIKTYTW